MDKAVIEKLRNRRKLMAENKRKLAGHGASLPSDWEEGHELDDAEMDAYLDDFQAEFEANPDDVCPPDEDLHHCITTLQGTFLCDFDLTSLI